LGKVGSRLGSHTCLISMDRLKIDVIGTTELTDSQVARMMMALMACATAWRPTDRKRLGWRYAR
jgi:hypothetical protein